MHGLIFLYLTSYAWILEQLPHYISKWKIGDLYNVATTHRSIKKFNGDKGEIYNISIKENIIFFSKYIISWKKLKYPIFMN